MVKLNKILKKELDKKQIKNIVLYFLSFLIPFFVIFVIFIYLKVYPFGEKTYLPVDANSQYSSFLMYFRDVFLGDNSIFYSLTKSIGSDIYGLFVYYLFSPYNFITLIFSKSNILLAFDTILILKTASSRTYNVLFSK